MVSWDSPKANPLGGIRAAIDRAQVRAGIEIQAELAARARWAQALDYIEGGGVEDPLDPLIRRITEWATHGGERPW